MFCSRYINARHGNAVWIIDPLWGESTGHHWIPLTWGMSFPWSTLFFNSETARYFIISTPSSLCHYNDVTWASLYLNNSIACSTACLAKEASMLCITCPFCEWYPKMTGGDASPRVNNSESISMAWRLYIWDKNHVKKVKKETHSNCSICLDPQIYISILSKLAMNVATTIMYILSKPCVFYW